MLSNVAAVLPMVGTADDTSTLTLVDDVAANRRLLADSKKEPLVLPPLLLDSEQVRKGINLGSFEDAGRIRLVLPIHNQLGESLELVDSVSSCTCLIAREVKEPLLANGVSNLSFQIEAPPMAGDFYAAAVITFKGVETGKIFKLQVSFVGANTGTIRLSHDHVDRRQPNQQLMPDSIEVAFADGKTTIPLVSKVHLDSQFVRISDWHMSDDNKIIINLKPTNSPPPIRTEPSRLTVIDKAGEQVFSAFLKVGCGTA